MAQETRARSQRKYPCEQCPLQRHKIFRNLNGSELDFVS